MNQSDQERSITNISQPTIKKTIRIRIVGRKRTNTKVQDTIERNTHPLEQDQTRDEVHGFDYAEETRDEFLDGWNKRIYRENRMIA